MRFMLDTVGTFYSDSESKEYEKLGFKFKDTEFNRKMKIVNKNKRPFVEINNFEELFDFVKEWGEIILNEKEITIFDDDFEQ